MKRKTAEVSSWPSLRGELLPHEGAARKDPAAYVSLSSYSLVKQPGNLGVPTLRLPEEPSKLHASENCRMSFHCSSEELQRRAIAPCSGRRADPPYIGEAPRGCQPENISFFWLRRPVRPARGPAPRPSRKQCLNWGGAALKPYSWVVLSVRFEGWIRKRRPSGRRQSVGLTRVAGRH